MDDDDDDGGSGAGVSFKRLRVHHGTTPSMVNVLLVLFFISLGFSDVGVGAYYEPDRNSSNIPSGHQYSQV